MTLKVQDPSPEVDAMGMEFAIIEAVMCGTGAMRAAGEVLLPKWPGEDATAYATRLKVATLFPAYRRTVSVMSGKPFSKALTYGDDVPPRIREMCEDVDKQGRNLHAFAADSFARTLAFGIAGIHIEYPKTAGVQTLAQEREMGARPYFRLVRHSQIIGWREADVGGSVKLSQIRIAETHDVPDGRFGLRVVGRVRVLEPGRWELWEEPANKGDDYIKIDEGNTDPVKAIPFVPLYGVREAFMVGKPPLMDVAYLNVKHWQSQSDQDNITHVARVPILVASGFDDPNEKYELTIGAGVATKLGTGRDLKYVEHTGAAIAVGRESLQDLEQQMIQAGAELLVKKPGARSATESANDAEGNKSDLQRIAEAFADALSTALQYMAYWIGEPTGGHVSLFSDYGAMSLGQASGQMVLAMQQGGLITKATAIQEMQRRGELDAAIDAEEELGKVGEEGPALGSMVDAPGAENDAPETAPAADMPAAGSAGPQQPPPAAPAVDLSELANILAAALAKLPAPVVNMPPMPAAGPITVEAPITVNMPEQPPANVTIEGSTWNVAPPAVTVEGATVNVTPAPVSVPVQVTIEKGGEVRFTENAAGEITGARIE